MAPKRPANIGIWDPVEISGEAYQLASCIPWHRASNKLLRAPSSTWARHLTKASMKKDNKTHQKRKFWEMGDGARYGKGLWQKHVLAEVWCCTHDTRTMWHTLSRPIFLIAYHQLAYRTAYLSCLLPISPLKYKPCEDWNLFVAISPAPGIMPSTLNTVNIPKIYTE